MQKIKYTIKETFSELSDKIASFIVLIIICVILIIAGTIISLFYGFLLGEKGLLGWAVTYSLPVLILTAICVAGSLISYVAVKLHAKLLGKILAVLFWVCTFFGPIIWTHLAKLFGAQEMIQHRRIAVLIPICFVLIVVLVMTIFENVCDAFKNRKQQKLQSN